MVQAGANKASIPQQGIGAKHLTAGAPGVCIQRSLCVWAAASPAPGAGQDSVPAGELPGGASRQCSWRSCRHLSAAGALGQWPRPLLVSDWIAPQAQVCACPHPCGGAYAATHAWAQRIRVHLKRASIAWDGCTSRQQRARQPFEAQCGLL